MRGLYSFVKQIKRLIEHKYLKRDEDNINLFIYMA